MDETEDSRPRRRLSPLNIAMLAWYAVALVGLSYVGFFHLPDKTDTYMDLGKELPLPVVVTINTGSLLGPGGPLNIQVILAMLPCVLLIVLAGNRRLATVAVGLVAFATTALPGLALIDAHRTHGEWEAAGLRPEDPFFRGSGTEFLREPKPGEGPRVRLVLRGDTTNAESNAVTKDIHCTVRGFSSKDRWLVIELKGEDARSIEATLEKARALRYVESAEAVTRPEASPDDRR